MFIKRILDCPQNPWMIYNSQSRCTVFLIISRSSPFHTYFIYGSLEIPNTPEKQKLVRRTQGHWLTFRILLSSSISASRSEHTPGQRCTSHSCFLWLSTTSFGTQSRVPLPSNSNRKRVFWLIRVFKSKENGSQMKNVMTDTWMKTDGAKWATENIVWGYSDWA